MNRYQTNRFSSLPAVARAYVALVMVAGTVGLVLAAWRVRLDHPGLFAMLLVLAVVTATAKIELPLGRSPSNLSLSHVVNFWALFALGDRKSVV